MGNSVAHPVLRTADPADPAEAYEKARHLCALPATRYAQVYVGAELRTVADVRLLNSDRCDWCEQVAGVHMLYVHVTKHGDRGRAERLAAAIGGAVPGEPEQG
ncbi:hypothetical protein [Streptomyces yangpuensis]|uniref:hypothetical protein n=1 Tax=Streptomyces yangpuensis TaxID=1648182 RepID=UPI00371431F7